MITKGPGFELSFLDQTLILGFSIFMTTAPTTFRSSFAIGGPCLERLLKFFLTKEKWVGIF